MERTTQVPRFLEHQTLPSDIRCLRAKHRRVLLSIEFLAINYFLRHHVGSPLSFVFLTIWASHRARSCALFACLSVDHLPMCVLLVASSSGFGMKSFKTSLQRAYLCSPHANNRSPCARRHDQCLFLSATSCRRILVEEEMLLHLARTMLIDVLRRRMCLPFLAFSSCSKIPSTGLSPHPQVEED